MKKAYNKNRNPPKPKIETLPPPPPQPVPVYKNAIIKSQTTSTIETEAKEEEKKVREHDKVQGRKRLFKNGIQYNFWKYTNASEIREMFLIFSRGISMFDIDDDYLYSNEFYEIFCRKLWEASI